jgi:hypothetical protein
MARGGDRLHSIPSMEQGHRLQPGEPLRNVQIRKCAIRIEDPRFKSTMTA